MTPLTGLTQVIGIQSTYLWKMLATCKAVGVKVPGVEDKLSAQLNLFLAEATNVKCLIYYNINATERCHEKRNTHCLREC